MSLTLKFNTVKELAPLHGQAIMYFGEISSFSFVEYRLQYAVVEYEWAHLDKEGDYTGNSMCIDPETDTNFKIGDMNNDFRLEMIFGGDSVSPCHLWIDAGEYHFLITKSYEEIK